ncbi:MAG TPA: hypothetical protein VJ788_07580 [Gemmatimonadota bacterium]|nr:hypothetical protein [Gemmatimonadota bacterium]
MTLGPKGSRRLGVEPPVSSARRLRHMLRTRVSEHPALYLPLARRKYPGPEPEVISSETQLVIDGYTRSAGTFAVYAFQLAQDEPVRIAHHLHAPAQLIAAARMRIPTLVLIREPQGAILSQLVQEPHVALRDALVAYARFYLCLHPYRRSFVVGEFNEVTQDLGAVIRRLNKRFGTSFGEFVHTEANMAECFDLIKERPPITERPTGSSIGLEFESGLATRDELRRERQRRYGPLPPRDLWVPSAEKEGRKAALRERWLQPELAAPRARAEAVYQWFLEEPSPAEPNS